MSAAQPALPLDVEPIEPQRHSAVNAVDPGPIAVPDVKLDTAAMHALLRQRYGLTYGNGPRYVIAPEVRNQAGFGGYFGDGRLRTADLLVMDTWPSGPLRLIGHEIKVSRSDWLRELKDPSKSAPFVAVCAEWWLVVADRKIVKDGELPPGWGLMAPAGDKFRAVVPALRKPQPDLPIGMTAAMLRRVQDVGQAEAAAARTPKPHTLNSYPQTGVYDDLPREVDGWTLRAPSEIQRPARRHRSANFGASA